MLRSWYSYFFENKKKCMKDLNSRYSYFVQANILILSCSCSSGKHNKATLSAGIIYWCHFLHLVYKLRNREYLFGSPKEVSLKKFGFLMLWSWMLCKSENKHRCLLGNHHILCSLLWCYWYIVGLFRYSIL